MKGKKGLPKPAGGGTVGFGLARQNNTGSQATSPRTGGSHKSTAGKTKKRSK